MELRLLTTMTAHRTTGYEVLFSVTDNTYVQIVRWVGGTNLSDFVYVTQNDRGPKLVTGNRIRATVTATGEISAYVDSGSGYVLVSRGTDATYTSGAPGVGFFNQGAGNNADFGISAFSVVTSDTNTTTPSKPSNVRIIRSGGATVPDR